MLVFHSPLSLLHNPPHEILSGSLQPYFESPDRYRRILAALLLPPRRGSTPFEERRLDWTKAEVLTPELDRAVRAVHDPAYLDFLASIYPEWVAEGGSRDAALPETFLRADMLLEPSDPSEAQGSAIARIGRHSFDLSAPVTADTYLCALASTRVALSALSALLDPASTARGVFALWCVPPPSLLLLLLSPGPLTPLPPACNRPPGHHATPTLCGGYCFVNSAAVAAREAQRLLGEARAGASAGEGGPKARVAVLDVDYHHGNGTSQVFYADPTVFYVSLHGAPDYPWYTGSATERGARGTRAEGTTLHVPLPLGTGDDAYVEALERAVERVRAWRPEVVVVSCVARPSLPRPPFSPGSLTPGPTPARTASAYTYVDDPLTEFRLSLDAYPRIGAVIASVGARTLFVMEGGYALDAVGACVRGVLEGFERASETG
ncbi:hypothetical protein JCM8208_007142 [Rhodotorula glutinis]